jgi:lysophospholipase L1-like esterase
MRRYSNGLVLVNPSKSAGATISVGTGYQRLAGTQDVTTNNGQAVNSVTLGPRQGLLLVKTSSIEPPPDNGGSSSGTPTSSPVISSSLTAMATVGTAFSYQITANNGPIVNYFASQLTPTAGAGIAPGLSGNGTTGLIYGTPTTAGTYTIRIGANNAIGTGTAVLTLAVAPAGGTAPLADPVCKYVLPSGDTTGYFKPVPRVGESTNADVAAGWAAANTGVGDIVFIGDSITGAWKFQPTLWNSMAPGTSKTNLGVGGDSVQTVANRIESGLLAALKPKVIVMMIGANNIGTSGPSGELLGRAIWNLAGLAKCVKPDAKVVLMGTLPRGSVGAADPSVDPILISKVLTSNAELARQLQAAPNAVRLLDISGHYMIGNELNQAMFTDQVHLTNLGYQKWAEQLGPVLTQLVN